MVYKKLPVKKISQATNSNLHWVRARAQFVAQLLVRLGHDLPPELETTCFHPPTILDEDLLKDLTLSLNQIVWWDEVHIKQKIGEVLDTVFRFAKNEHNTYDEDGDINEEGMVRDE